MKSIGSVLAVDFQNAAEIFQIDLRTSFVVLGLSILLCRIHFWHLERPKTMSRGFSMVTNKKCPLSVTPVRRSVICDQVKMSESYV